MNGARLLPAAVLAVAVLATGCGSSSPAPAPSVSAASLDAALTRLLADVPDESAVDGDATHPSAGPQVRCPFGALADLRVGTDLPELARHDLVRSEHNRGDSHGGVDDVYCSQVLGGDVTVTLALVRGPQTVPALTVHRRVVHRGDLLGGTLVSYVTTKGGPACSATWVPGADGPTVSLAVGADRDCGAALTHMLPGVLDRLGG